jgi:hypothetical protein
VALKPIVALRGLLMVSDTDQAALDEAKRAQSTFDAQVNKLVADVKLDQDGLSWFAVTLLIAFDGMDAHESKLFFSGLDSAGRAEIFPVGVEGLPEAIKADYLKKLEKRRIGYEQN